MTTEIKDGIYAYVSGTATRINDGRFTIEVLKDGNRYPERITVWKPNFPVNDGDRVSVKGWLSWRKSKKDERYIDYSLNEPQLAAQQAAPAPVAAADDSWNIPTGINSDSIPF